jgi:hypothetical protein
MLTTGRTPGMTFYVRGSNDEDSLMVAVEGFKCRLRLHLPAAALPWRDLTLIEKWGRRREPYGCCDVKDPLDDESVSAKGAAVEVRTGIRGGEAVAITGGVHQRRAARHSLPPRGGRCDHARGRRGKLA